ncbi:MAG: NAD(P)H-dependent oxidoreductase [Halopseudomonas aestusnigri]
MNILRIDSSPQSETGQSIRLANRIISGLDNDKASITIQKRDLSRSLPAIDQEWITANKTPDEERTAEQKDILELSDSLISEIGKADVLIIGAPIYNFTIPVGLKAWVDLVCRSGKTFAYGEDGRKGLMTGKRAIVIYSSGGTPFGSDIDFASGYLRHILKFIGITDVKFVIAEQHFMDPKSLEKAGVMADQISTELSAVEQKAS